MSGAPLRDRILGVLLKRSPGRLRSVSVSELLRVNHDDVFAAMRSLVDDGELIGATVVTGKGIQVEAGMPMSGAAGKTARAQIASGPAMKPPAFASAEACPPPMPVVPSLREIAAAAPAAPDAPAESQPAAPGSRKAVANAKRDAILRALADAGRGLSHIEVCKASGVASGSVAWLLGTLVHDRKVNCTGIGHGRRYSIRPGVEVPEATWHDSIAAVAAAVEDAVALTRDYVPDDPPMRPAVEARADELRVGLFSDGRLDLQLGDQVLKLTRDNTRELFRFLDRIFIDGLGERA